MAQKGIRLVNEVTVDNRSLEAAARRINTRLKSAAVIDGRKIEGIARPLGKITGQADEFTKSLAASNARVIAFGASVAIINGVTDAFRGLVQQTIKVEKVFADINVVLGANQRELARFGQGIFDVARNTAQSFDTVAEGALEFARQGLGMEESLKRINDALILTRLTGLDVTESVEGLTAAVNTFKKEGITTGQVINKLAELDIAFAVSSEDLIKGLERAGGSAGQARVSFEELAAMIAVVQERTARGGSVIGNALRTIFARIQGEDVINSLEEIGIKVRDIDTNKMLSATQILEQLSQAFSDAGKQEKLFGALGIALDDIEKADVVQQVAGKRQRETLIALFQEMEDGTGRWADALEKVGSNADTAYRKNEQLNQTLDAILKQTGVSIQQLAARIGELSISDNFKELVSGFNDIIQGINKLLSPEEGSNVMKGFLKGFGDAITSTPVLGLLLAVVGKLTVDMVAFGVKGLKSLLGLNSAAQQQLNLQESILRILLSEPVILEELTKKGLSRVEQERLLLKVLQQQEKEYLRLKSIAASITPAIYKAGGRSGKGGITVPTSAGGFIPNAVQLEKENIRKGVGGARPSDRPVTLSNFNYGGGRRGPMIANSGEYLVSNYKGAGSAIFNREMAAMYGLPAGARPIAAGGYVPNFARNPYQFRRLSELQRINPDKLSAAERKQYDAALASKQLGGEVFNADTKGVVMLIPQVGSGAIPIDSRFTKARRGKSGKTYSGFVGSAYGINKDIRKQKRFNNLVGFDRNVEGSLEDMAAGVLNKMAPDILTDPKQPIKGKTFKELLKEGGAGALAAFKGAIFEALISAIVGGAKSDRQGTLDVDFDAVNGDLLREIFGIKKKYRLGDYKVSLDAKSKFIEQAIANVGAGGYDPLGDAIRRENAAGIPINQIRVNQSGKLRNSKNPMGLAVTNTRDEPTGRIPNYAKVGRTLSAEEADRVRGAGQKAAVGFEGLTTKLFALSFAVDIIAGTFASEENNVGQGIAKFVSSLTTGALILSTFSDIIGGAQRKITSGKGLLGKLGGTGFGKQLAGTRGLGLVGGPIGLGVAAVGGIALAGLKAQAAFNEADIARTRKSGLTSKDARASARESVKSALEGKDLAEITKILDGGEIADAKGIEGVTALLDKFNVALPEVKGLNEEVATLNDLQKQLENAKKPKFDLYTGKQIDNGYQIASIQKKITEQERVISGIKAGQLNTAKGELDIIKKRLEAQRQQAQLEAVKFFEKDALNAALDGFRQVREIQIDTVSTRERELALQTQSLSLTREQQLAAEESLELIKLRETSEKRVIDILTKGLEPDKFFKLKKIGEEDYNGFKNNYEKILKLIKSGELNSGNVGTQVGKLFGDELSANGIKAIVDYLEEALTANDNILTAEKEKLRAMFDQTIALENQNREQEKYLSLLQRNADLTQFTADRAFNHEQRMAQLRRENAITAIESQLGQSGFLPTARRATLENQLTTLQRRDQFASLDESAVAERREVGASFRDAIIETFREQMAGGNLSEDLITEITADASKLDPDKAFDKIFQQAKVSRASEGLINSLQEQRNSYDKNLDEIDEQTAALKRNIEAADAFQRKINELLGQGTGQAQFKAGVLEFGNELRQESDTFWYRIGQEAPAAFRDNMAQALSQANQGASSLGDALSDAARNFLSMMEQAFMRSAVNNLMLAFGFGGGSTPTIGMASGGLVRGGSGVRDDVPAYLMDGEYVIKKDAVRKYGVDYLKALNSQAVPQMAYGGRFAAVGYGRDEIRGVDALREFGNTRVTSGATDIISSQGGVSAIDLEVFSKKLTSFGRGRSSPMRDLIREQQAEALGLVDQFEEYKRAEKERKKEELKRLIVSTVLSAAASYGTAKFNQYQTTGTAAKNAGLTRSEYKDFLDSVPEAQRGATTKWIASWPQGAMGGPMKGNANLMGGEFRMSPKAVALYGEGFMDRLNNMSMPAPQYASGGMVGSSNTSMGQQRGGDTNINITVNRDGSSTTQSDGGVNGQEEDSRMAEKIRKEVVRIIEGEKRQGGALSNRKRGV